jgi:protein-L-isoaspartate O-methyltransferase
LLHLYTKNSLSRAHADEPLREGHIHISAPHIYGCIVEALHVTPNSSISFLNIGSGTGYLSSIVAHIVGSTGICYGIEINRQAYEHGVSSVNRWKEENDHVELPLLEFIRGNGLNIDAKVGEAIHGFDRIYVGAAVERSKLNELASLLRLGGILVGPGMFMMLNEINPGLCVTFVLRLLTRVWNFVYVLLQPKVDDELLQVTRVRNSNDTLITVPRSIRGGPPTLSEEFTEHVVTGVRFASLVHSPSMPTVIHSRIWGPSLHKHYPETFRNSCKEILLCSQASMYQPPPIVPIVREESTINVASQLPKSIWLEILTYTHRDWFEQPQPEAEVLRRRLEQEQLAAQRADEARREAEMRLRMMERERDGYRRLALRTQARLQTILNERGDASSNVNEPEDMLTDDETSQILSRFSRSRVVLSLSGMNALIRQFQQELSDDDQDDEIDDDEENSSADDHTNHTDIGAETLDDVSQSNSGDNNSDGLDTSSSESILPTVHVSHSSDTSSMMTISRPSRTISVSSDDMKISQI